jgi:hypothetical protein
VPHCCSAENFYSTPPYPLCPACLNIYYITNHLKNAYHFFQYPTVTNFTDRIFLTAPYPNQTLKLLIYNCKPFTLITLTHSCQARLLLPRDAVRTTPPSPSPLPPFSYSLPHNPTPFFSSISPLYSA